MFDRRTVFEENRDCGALEFEVIRLRFVRSGVVDV